MNATAKLKAATSYLIVRHPFLVVPLLRLSFSPSDSVTTAATDGRAIFYNPAFLDELSSEQTIFLLAHEVLHVILGHHLRRESRNPKAWNAAGDFVINWILQSSGFAPIEGALLEASFAGWSTERVYEALIQQAEKQVAEARSARSTIDDWIPEGRGGDVIDMRSVADQPLSQAEKSAAEVELAVTLHQAHRAATMSCSDYFLRTAVSRATQPQSPGFDARAELAELLTTVACRENYTWARPNHRYLPSGFYLPALADGLALHDPIVAIDTSSSIDSSLLAFMAGFCDDLLSTFPDTILRVAYCDTAVRSTEELAAYDRPVTLRHAQGGGGTHFGPLFDWIARNDYQPRFVLYLTDMECSDRPEDPGYPVVWLNVGRTKPTPFFGRRIDLVVGS